MRGAALLVTLVAVAPLAAGASATVTAFNIRWEPAMLGVLVGDTVSFVNGGGSHDWVSDSGLGSCTLPCVRAFAAPGLSKYHCGIHGPSMSGAIRVLRAHAPELVVAIASGATTTTSVQQATFRVDVQNQGTLASAPTTVRVEYDAPSGTRQPITTLAVPALAPGAVATLAVLWRDGKIRVGAFAVHATVDPDGLVAEDDETDNTASGTATFLHPLVPRQQV